MNVRVSGSWVRAGQQLLGVGTQGHQLLVEVSRRFYLDDASKTAIAQEFGLSRFQVARLLQSARNLGIVRIRVEDASTTREDLGLQLIQTLHLRRAAVLGASSTHSVDQHRADLGALAARELQSVITADDVLGLPWSRSVAAMANALTALPPVTVVQLSGVNWVSNRYSTPMDIVRDVAMLGGGSTYRFHAPFVAFDATAAASLRRDPAYLATQAVIGDITVAVVSVGGFDPERSTLYSAATPEELAVLTDGGAVAEVCGVFIDADGLPVPGSFIDRLLTVTADQLSAIPHVIGLGMGRERAAAVRAACRGGLIDTLVVDLPLAQALLRQ